MSFLSNFFFAFVSLSICGVVFLLLGDSVFHACCRVVFLTGEGCLDCEACVA